MISSRLDTRSYYTALDGLRGVAILLVLFHHNLDFIPLPKFGWVGVDLFFVLSGFLITDILLREKSKKHFLLNFYIRRGLRILPLYYLIIILFLLFGSYFSALNDQYEYYSFHQVFLWTNTHNWLSIVHEKPNNHMLLYHFWSLSLEEQFYLFWPLLIKLIKKPEWLVKIAFAILIACIFMRIGSWLYFGDGDLNYQLQSFNRADGLCIGSLIALWKYMNPETLKKKVFVTSISLVGIHILVFIVIKLFVPGIPHFRFLFFTTIAAVFGMLVWYAISGKGNFKKKLGGNKILKWLGKISYGLYVFHWPVLVLFRIYFTDELESVGFSTYYSYVILSVGAALTALLISHFSYTLFEKKFLTIKDRFS